MNVWTFTGHLGKDAELKYTSSGDPVCEFSVAVTSGYGERKKTTWANCALFGKAASGGLPEYLKKGVQVAVSGELTLDEWQGKDGTAQKALKIRVASVDLIGGNGMAAAQPHHQSARNSAPTYREQPAEQPRLASAPATNPPPVDSFDDDIPF
jgi:single-strand DNA-binding protein